MYAGWIPIERSAEKYRHRFCEAERHRGSFTRSVAVACITDTPEGDLLWGICQECLNDMQVEGFPVEPLA